MKTWILETPRLLMRQMTEEDLPDLREILQDEKTMYAYEHAFSEQEVLAWLENQKRRYREDGFGLLALLLKETGEMVGQAGLTKQRYLQEEKEKAGIEIGYLLKRRFWHQGYATEAAAALKQYAFDTLELPAVCSIIRDTNTASQKVALRNGMKPICRFVKHYYGVDMPHDVYWVENPAVSGEKKEAAPTCF